MPQLNRLFNLVIDAQGKSVSKDELTTVLNNQGSEVKLKYPNSDSCINNMLPLLDNLSAFLEKNYTFWDKSISATNIASILATVYDCFYTICEGIYNTNTSSIKTPPFKLTYQDTKALRNDISFGGKYTQPNGFVKKDIRPLLEYVKYVYKDYKLCYDDCLACAIILTLASKHIKDIVDGTTEDLIFGHNYVLIIENLVKEEVKEEVMEDTKEEVKEELNKEVNVEKENTKEVKVDNTVVNDFEKRLIEIFNKIDEAKKNNATIEAIKTNLSVKCDGVDNDIVNSIMSSIKSTIDTTLQPLYDKSEQQYKDLVNMFESFTEKFGIFKNDSLNSIKIAR